jgi:hypothetical protein
MLARRSATKPPISPYSSKSDSRRLSKAELGNEYATATTVALPRIKVSEMFRQQNNSTSESGASSSETRNSNGFGRAESEPKKLSDHDQHELDIRANPREVQKACRQYTATEPEELSKLGFSKAQSANVPALVSPVWTVDGDVDGHEITPSHPRQDAKGKIRKRELLPNWRTRLFVSPVTLQHVGDPRIPMLLTESMHKATAGALWPDVEVLALGTFGVTGVRGKNKFGGIVFLDDFDKIAFKGRDENYVGLVRDVWLIPDSNFSSNKDVRRETLRTAAQLERKGARVHIVALPSGPNGKSFGLDDWRAANPNAAFADLCALEWKDSTPFEPSARYERTPDGLVLNTIKGGVPVAVSLTNFDAEIVEDVVRNDGAEKVREYRVQVSHQGLVFTAAVPADDFDSFGWMNREFGSKPYIHAGQGIRDHARAAIHELSDPRKREVRVHSGWMEDNTGLWQFLHAGGAIGGLGQGQDIEVELPPQLQHVNIPPAPPEQVRTGIVSSLKLLDLAPDHIMVPLFSSIWRAVLGNCDFSLHIHGRTGLFKSALTALAWQHYGRDLGVRCGMPSWNSTANYLLGLAFQSKDALLPIDDLFGPDVSPIEKIKKMADVDRLFRSAGNISDRGRMRADTTLRPSKPPRCLFISTGEENLRGESLLARVWAVSITEEDAGLGRMNLDLLSRCQADAAAGLHANAMRGFIEWLAPQYNSVQRSLRSRVVEYRNKSATEIGNCHARTPGMLAELFAGFETFINFATGVGAITAERANELQAHAWSALIAGAAVQAHTQAGQEPAHRFIELVMASISAGKAWLRPLVVPKGGCEAFSC